MKCHYTIYTYMAERCNGDFNKHFWSHVCLQATVEYLSARGEWTDQETEIVTGDPPPCTLVWCMCIWVSRAKCSRWQQTCTVWNYIDSHHITRTHTGHWYISVWPGQTQRYTITNKHSINSDQHVCMYVAPLILGIICNYNNNNAPHTALVDIVRLWAVYHRWCVYMCESLPHKSVLITSVAIF